MVCLNDLFFCNILCLLEFGGLDLFVLTYIVTKNTCVLVVAVLSCIALLMYYMYVYFSFVVIHCISLCIFQCILECISVPLCTWYIYPVISCICSFYLCMGMNSCVFVRLCIYSFSVLHYLEVWFDLLLLNWFEFPSISLVVPSVINCLFCILFKIWMFPLLYFLSDFPPVDTIHGCLSLFSLLFLLYLI